MKKFNRRNAFLLSMGLAASPITFAAGGFPGHLPGHFPINPPGHHGSQDCFEDVQEEAQELGQELRNVIAVVARIEFRGPTQFAAERASREAFLFAQSMGRSCNQIQLRRGFAQVAQSVANVKNAFRQSRRLVMNRDAVRAIKDMDEEFEDLADEVREASRFGGRG